MHYFFVRFHEIALLIENFHHCQITCCPNHMLHLHCLHGKNRVTLFQFIALFHKYLRDSSRHGSDRSTFFSFFLFWLLSCIRLEFITDWITNWIKKVYFVLIINEKFNLSNLPINCNTQLIWLGLKVLENKAIFSDLCNSILAINESAGYFSLMFSIDESLFDMQSMSLSAGCHISEVGEFCGELKLRLFADLSCDNCSNESKWVMGWLLLEKFINIFRNIARIVLSFSKNWIRNDSLQELQIIG